MASLLLSLTGDMSTIRANCRERFTADDLDFLAKAVGSQLPDADASRSALHALLAEPAALDAALESDKLLKAILEQPATIFVSPQFYFYVLTRHMLLRFDRAVADYVAGMLAGFVDAQHGAPGGQVLPYVSDMLIALRSASSEREFMIRVQVGNCSLFFSGIFPQHIAHRSTHRAAPPISFYEEVGSQNYRLASSHPLAREQSLVDTYRTIAEHFSEVRIGLNQLSDRLLCLEPAGSLPA
jgi:hypothetical protein